VRTTLRTDDIAAALGLSDAAGWNQTADDWAFFIDRGALGERDPATGRLVATAATLGYGGFGWISMVLVAAGHRHHGLAGRLVDASIATLRAVGAVPVLDATPAGHPVYAAAGFTDGFAFERWERAGPAAVATGPGPVADAPALDDLARLDAAASGLDRHGWWADVARRRGTRAVRDEAAGFALLRAGRRAAQLGPVVADDEAAAIRLVERALAATDGARTFIDVPVARRELLAHLERIGFVRQRPFTRMAQGSAPPALGARQFAFAGPEFG
jgi:GNAT superfamily N-acetyltransferase